MHFLAAHSLSLKPAVQQCGKTEALFQISIFIFSFHILDYKNKLILHIFVSKKSKKVNLWSKLYLNSLSCRIPTGSNPWGFWTGVIRFCFCCIWSMGDTCCPGGWTAPELPGTGPGAPTGAWGGAGDGRPLGTGVRCFCAWLSVAWPGKIK